MHKVKIDAEKVSRIGLIIALVGIPVALLMLVFVIGYAVRAFVG